MSKKRAILLVLLGEAIIYLFLLVGWPMFTRWFYAPTTCTEGGNLPVIWPAYFIPALIGFWYSALILRKKKEAKGDEQV